MGDIRTIIEKIQISIYPRRPRVKESFVDYDPLHRGTVSLSRFIRCVHAFNVRGVTQSDIDKLAEAYKRDNGDIDYVQFTHAIDEVFGPVNLEKTPMLEVLPPGATIPPKFMPGKVDNEEKLHAIMHRIALLEKTRGVLLKSCFQDSDRADCTSLTVPRRCGKINENNFRRNFPFKNEFSEPEMQMILQRYRDESYPDQINYQALHDAVTDNIKHKNKEELPTSDFIPRPNNLTWTQDDISAVERIQARIVERRVRPRQYFQDFDPLRKGYCSMSQVRTVFSILNLDVSIQDFETLCNKYCRPHDEMFHYDAFQTKVDEVFTTRGLEMTPMARPTMPSPANTLAARKNCVQLDAQYDDKISWTEQKIRSRVHELQLPLKDIFRDYDKQRTGHLTCSQFARVLATLDLGLSLEDLEAVALKFCDHGNTRDVNYVEFCEVVDPVPEGIKLAGRQNFRMYETPIPPQYFDKNGEVIPAN